MSCQPIRSREEESHTFKILLRQALNHEIVEFTVSVATSKNNLFFLSFFFEPQLHADLLLHFSSFFLFYFFFLFFFVVVHRSSSWVLFLCVCFWSNSNKCTVPHYTVITNAQNHTNSILLCWILAA